MKKRGRKRGTSDSIQGLYEKISKEVDENLPAILEANANSKLSYGKRIFAEGLALGKSVTEAWRDAFPGPFNPKAYQMRNLPEIQEEIARKIRAREIASLVTREWVLYRLVQILEEQDSEPKPNHIIQLRVLEMIARMNHYLSPDSAVQINQNGNEITVNIVRSPDQLGEPKQE